MPGAPFVFLENVDRLLKSPGGPAGARLRRHPRLPRRARLHGRVACRERGGLWLPRSGAVACSSSPTPRSATTRSLRPEDGGHGPSSSCEDDADQGSPATHPMFGDAIAISPNVVEVSETFGGRSATPFMSAGVMHDFKCWTYSVEPSTVEAAGARGRP